MRRNVRAEATLVYHLFSNSRPLPDHVDMELVRKAYKMAMSKSTGLTSDMGFDEKRFCELYIALKENEDEIS